MNKLERVGDCSICNRRSDFNTPKLRSDNGDLVCDRCGDLGFPEDVVLIGVDQYMESGEYRKDTQRQVYQLNGNVLWIKLDCTVDCAWTRGGRHSFKFHESELHLSEIELLDLMARKHDDEHFRCSTCEKDFDGQPSGYPLFAGISCEKCWKEHEDEMNKQKRNGQVCSMCKQPYGRCCC